MLFLGYYHDELRISMIAQTNDINWEEPNFWITYNKSETFCVKLLIAQCFLNTEHFSFFTFNFSIVTFVMLKVIEGFSVFQDPKLILVHIFDFLVNTKSTILNYLIFSSNPSLIVDIC